MKNILKKYVKIIVLVPVLWSCNEGFGDFNQNPVAVSNVDPALLFSGSVVNTANYNPEQLTSYYHAFMQYGWSDSWVGIRYQLSDNASNRVWGRYYGTVLKNLEVALSELRTSSESANTYHAARVWRVFVYQKLTDMYGDIPYTNAAKAFETREFTPAYDTQQSIYADLIKELREAINGFDVTAKGVQGDQFYGGDVEKWKKLANSMLLRIGMRLSKVDPTRADALVKEAVAGGVMTSNEDEPIVKYDDFTPNGFFENLGDQHFQMQKTLVRYMVDNDDPRLRIYSAYYKKRQSNDTIKSTKADLLAHAWDINSTIGSSGADSITRVRYDLFRVQGLPFYHFPYSQVEFLLAEAILRGYTTGSASAHYEAAITAHMRTMSSLAPRNQINNAQITRYLTDNPLSGTTEEQIEQVSNEFWVSGFVFQADEVWSHWRRTGYPALTPVPANYVPPGGVGGSDSPGVIPRKMPYPQSEFIYNLNNVTNALRVYGSANDFNPEARVWWDKAE